MVLSLRGFAGMVAADPVRMAEDHQGTAGMEVAPRYVGQRTPHSKRHRACAVPYCTPPPRPPVHESFTHLPVGDDERLPNTPTPTPVMFALPSLVHCSSAGMLQLVPTPLAQYPHQGTLQTTTGTHDTQVHALCALCLCTWG